MNVGDIVELTVYCMDNPPGTIGLCYEAYQIDGRTGVAIIFANGEYSGFSEDEQTRFLKFREHNAKFANYKFANVIQMTRDFKFGHFEDLFK